MKLDVGSGNLPLAGWTTVDLYEPANVCASMLALPYDDGTIEAINCSHALEHLTMAEGRLALLEFRRVLRHRGILTVEVPDLSAACRRYVEGIGEDRRMALSEFRRVLRHRGVLTVEVPDLSAACRRYVEGIGEDRRMAYQAIYGGEDPSAGLRHRSGYDAFTLAEAIAKAGFETSPVDLVWSHGIACLRTEAFVP